MATTTKSPDFVISRELDAPRELAADQSKTCKPIK
jgi:hypothetical protein